MKPAKTSILKIVLIVMPIVLVLLLIWIGFVYIGNVYFHSNAIAGQYLLWLMSSLIIFLFYPLFGKILLSRWIFRKKHWAAVTDFPKINKAGWLFFALLHLGGMVVLFWVFSDIQHHTDIHNYFTDHFGRDRRGRPRFPIMVLFMLAPVIVFTAIYLVVVKIKYGTFKEPRFTDSKGDLAFQENRKVYFTFVFSTSVIAFLCYMLRMVVLV
jgi:hypothetical protein